MKITKMFIHIEYSLQMHCYYKRVQGTTLQSDTRAVYIDSLLAFYDDVSYPTALQDNSYRAKESDGDRLTKKATQDRFKPITLTWSSARAGPYRR